MDALSLCTVLYKIISKVLANRVKPFLRIVISESQSAFVANWWTTDNVLLAFEAFHCMKIDVPETMDASV